MFDSFRDDRVFVNIYRSLEMEQYMIFKENCE
jgi:hypothetical protein